MWTSQNRMSVGKNVAKLLSFFLLTIQHHFTIQISATSLVTLSIDGKYFAFYFNAFFLIIADKAIFNFNFFSPPFNFLCKRQAEDTNLQHRA